MMKSKLNKMLIRESLKSEFPHRTRQVDTLCNLIVEVSKASN